MIEASEALYCEVIIGCKCVKLIKEQSYRAQMLMLNHIAEEFIPSREILLLLENLGAITENCTA